MISSGSFLTKKRPKNWYLSKGAHVEWNLKAKAASHERARRLGKCVLRRQNAERRPRLIQRPTRGTFTTRTEVHLPHAPELATWLKKLKFMKPIVCRVEVPKCRVVCGSDGLGDVIHPQESIMHSMNANILAKMAHHRWLKPSVSTWGLIVFAQRTTFP